MTQSAVVKLLVSSASFVIVSSTLAGCGLASLPGNYTPMEKQTVQELSSSNYTPRSADERAAILTQDLFAQAAFWSHEYDLNPADLEAAINLSSTLRRLGNPHKSIEVAQTTRALYPRDVDLMAELAASHIAANNPKQAIPIIDSALAQRPNMARLWSLKGAALDQFEQFAEARQHYSKALSIAPNDPGVIANVGLSYALEGDPKTAEIWLRRAANIPGASPSVRQNLSLVLGLQNKFDEAEKWAGRDLDEQSASNNMSYIRTLRGGSSPQVNVQKPIGTPTYSRPQRPAANLAPKTYGQAPRTAPVQPTSTAGYQRPTDTVQKPVQQIYAPQSRISRPAPKLTNYGQTIPAQAGDISRYEGVPTNSREAARAAARNAANKGATAPTTSASPAPQNVLEKISQNNTPKTRIAHRQKQEQAARAQRQYQTAMQARQQMPPQTPQPYAGQTVPYGTAQPYPYTAYPQAMTQMPPAGQPRQPARQRRR